jgi:hypothetical protein
MKNAWRIALVIAVLCLCGCASTQGGVNYTSLAKEHEFSYFFPKPAFVHTFATIEEAFDYVKTAQAKFSVTSGKPLAKGLAAKLIGPPVTGEQPVTVACILSAQRADSSNIDLADTSRPYGRINTKRYFRI